MTQPPRKKAGRKPLPLTEEERKERRRAQNRRAQSSFRKRHGELAREVEATTGSYENLRKSYDQLRARAMELQAALALTVVRLPEEDSTLVAARRLAAMPLPEEPEMPEDYSGGDNDSTGGNKPGQDLAADCKAGAPFESVAATLLSLGSSLSHPSTPFPHFDATPRSDFSAISPSVASVQPPATDPFPFDAASDFALFGVPFEAGDGLFAALRESLSSQEQLDGVAEELLRELGIIPPNIQPQGGGSMYMAEAQCCDANADEARLRVCFDSVPNLNIRALLHALHSAGFTNVPELCNDLKAFAHCAGDLADVKAWTLPRQMFEKWPVLRGIPIGER